MIKKKLLSVSDLVVSLGNKKIINNFNLSISPGETHVIMGPNGVGKSTLARLLAGKFDNYELSGSVFFDGYDLRLLSQTEISLKGLFLSFQQPVEISGVSNIHFLKSFINCKRKYSNLDPIETGEFLSIVKLHMQKLNMKEDLLNRSVNVDFSGGEKKKNEMLQMLLLNPKLVILDEIDSGLDVDALKDVFKCINSFRTNENSVLMITHYGRILNYIDVNFTHIMYNGSIVETGGKELLEKVDKSGYFPYS